MVKWHTFSVVFVLFIFYFLCYVQSNDNVYFILENYYNNVKMNDIIY